MNTTVNKQYPIGKLDLSLVTIDQVAEAILTIKSFPETVSMLLKDISSSSLKNQYRQDSWTLEQLIHHCADSHINAFVRFKWALTEDCPVIKPYLEKEWANLPDGQNYNIEISLRILHALHERMTYLLGHLTPSQLSRTLQHPDDENPTTIYAHILKYQWHCKHHLEHIKLCIEQPYLG